MTSSGEPDSAQGPVFPENVPEAALRRQMQVCEAHSTRSPRRAGRGTERLPRRARRPDVQLLHVHTSKPGNLTQSQHFQRG